MKAQEWSQHFSHYKFMGMDFSWNSKGTNSPAGCLVWQNFEPIHDFMVVLVTCKTEGDPIKNKGARVVTNLIIIFSNAQGQLTQ